MADTKISALTAATTPLAGTEVLPIVQSGVTKQVSVADLTAGRAVSMLSATAGNIQIASNQIYSTNSNGVINLMPNGTGRVQVGQQTASGARVSDFIGPNVTTLGTIADSMVNLYAQSGTGVNGTINLTYGVLASGATYGAGALALKWTSTSGYGKGDLLVALRDVTTDSAPTEVWRFTSDGSIKQAVASKGINFTANTAAAGMTSQLLNWYEEGTFTPTVFGGTTTGTCNYTVQIGRYTRIGRQVTVNIYLEYNTHTGTGTMNFGGLPYNASTFFSAHFGLVNNLTLTALNVLTGTVQSGTNSILLRQYPVGGGAASSVSMDAGAEIICTAVYFV